MALLRHLHQRSSKGKPDAAPSTAVVRKRASPDTKEEDEGSPLYRAVIAMDSALEEERHGEAIHASSLSGMCLRKHVLSNLHGSPSSRAAYSGERIVWALGRAAEHHVRTQYIQAVKGAGVFGVWSCRCGRTTHRGEFRGDCICTVCNYAAAHYGEFVLRDAGRGIVGNPDLVIRQPSGKLRVVEIKSMRKEDFAELAAATEDHKVQAAMYCAMLEQEFKGKVDAKASVFYVCKDYAFRPYKEFLFDPFRGDTAAVVKRLLAKATEATAALETAKKGGGLPPRIAACSTSASTTAKNCSSCAICFAV